jgi:hypothetical protein
MSSMIENDPCAACERIRAEGRMPAGKAGELRGVAVLALIVGKLFQIRFLAAMFLVACGARNIPVDRPRIITNE